MGRTVLPAKSATTQSGVAQKMCTRGQARSHEKHILVGLYGSSNQHKVLKICFYLIPTRFQPCAAGAGF